MNVKYKPLIFIAPTIVLVLLLYLFLSGKAGRSSIEELLIPEIKALNGGIIKSTGSKEGVHYFLTKAKSEIVINNDIRYYQKANRYVELNGIARPKIITGDFYRSVIVELIPASEKKEYFFIPLDEKNRFTGYIYLREKALYTVNCYLFIDYVNTQKINLPHNIDTTASLRFKIDAVGNVPENLQHLLPTKNIDCGNRLIRDLSCSLTKDCKTNLDKARKIYEFLVFGDSKGYKFGYKNYKKIYISCREASFHNTYIASQILLKKRGVCNDFAEVYAAMMRSLGFKVKKVWGFTDYEKKIGHMWNVIDITGDEKKWLRVDPTWGNQDKKHYKKWAELYDEFDPDYFENGMNPYNHKSFSYEQKIEY